MTFAEALAELGIDLSARPDQARRAYLRLLKTRKPEIDPQGFMRLRAAYELLKPHLEMLDQARRDAAAQAETSTNEGPTSDHEPAPIEEPPTSEPAPVEEPPTPAEGPPAPVEEPPTSEPTPVEEPPAPVEEPPAEEPPTSDHEPVPAEEPPTSDQEPAEEPPPSDREQPSGGGEERSFLVSARELASRFDAARIDARASPPSLFETQHLLLILHAVGEVAAARALFESASAWLRASGQEARLLRGESAALWALTRDLCALPTSFSQTIRAVLARGAVGSDLGAVTGELAELRKERPAAAREAAVVLRGSAPILAAAVADTLDPPAAPGAPGATTGSGSRRWVWALAVVAFGVVRIFLGAVSPRAPSLPFDASRFPSPRFEVPRITYEFDAGRSMEIMFKQQAIDHARKLKAHLDYAMADAGAKQQKRLEKASERAASLEEALAADDCKTAKARAAEIKASFAPDGGLGADSGGQFEAMSTEVAVGSFCLSVNMRVPQTTDSP